VIALSTSFPRSKPFVPVSVSLATLNPAHQIYQSTRPESELLSTSKGPTAAVSSEWRILTVMRATSRFHHLKLSLGNFLSSLKRLKLGII